MKTMTAFHFSAVSVLSAHAHTSCRAETRFPKLRCGRREGRGREEGKGKGKEAGEGKVREAGEGKRREAGGGRGKEAGEGKGREAREGKGREAREGKGREAGEGKGREGRGVMPVSRMYPAVRCYTLSRRTSVRFGFGSHFLPIAVVRHPTHNVPHPTPSPSDYLV